MLEFVLADEIRAPAAEFLHHRTVGGDGAVEAVQHAIDEAGPEDVHVLAVAFLADGADVERNLIRPVPDPFLRDRPAAGSRGAVEQPARGGAGVAAHRLLPRNIHDERQSARRPQQQFDFPALGNEVAGVAHARIGRDRRAVLHAPVEEIEQRLGWRHVAGGKPVAGVANVARAHHREHRAVPADEHRGDAAHGGVERAGLRRLEEIGAERYAAVERLEVDARLLGDAARRSDLLAKRIDGALVGRAEVFRRAIEGVERGQQRHAAHPAFRCLRDRAPGEKRFAVNLRHQRGVGEAEGRIVDEAVPFAARIGGGVEANDGRAFLAPADRRHQMIPKPVALQRDGLRIERALVEPRAGGGVGDAAVFAPNVDRSVVGIVRGLCGDGGIGGAQPGKHDAATVHLLVEVEQILLQARELDAAGRGRSGERRSEVNPGDDLLAALGRAALVGAVGPVVRGVEHRSTGVRLDAQHFALGHAGGDMPAEDAAEPALHFLLEIQLVEELGPHRVDLLLVVAGGAGGRCERAAKIRVGLAGPHLGIRVDRDVGRVFLQQILQALVPALAVVGEFHARAPALQEQLLQRNVH